MKFNFLKIAFSQVGRLSEDEELELLKRFQQEGDMRAYRKLRLSLRPLIEKAIADRVPAGNDVSAFSLRSRAEKLMPKILDKYDPNNGTKLNTFILSHLYGNFRNAVSESMVGPYVPRNLHSDLDHFVKAKLEAQMEYGANPTRENIRQFYPNKEGITPFEDIEKYHVKSYMSDAVYGEDDDGDGVSFKDQFTANDDSENDDLYDSLYEDEEDEIMKSNFNHQEQEVIKRVHKQGQPFVQVSLSLGISTSDVRKIMRRWVNLTDKNVI